MKGKWLREISGEGRFSTLAVRLRKPTQLVDVESWRRESESDNLPRVLRGILGSLAHFSTDFWICGLMHGYAVAGNSAGSLYDVSTV